MSNTNPTEADYLRLEREGIFADSSRRLTKTEQNIIQRQVHLAARLADADLPLLPPFDDTPTRGGSSFTPSQPEPLFHPSAEARLRAED